MSSSGSARLPNYSEEFSPEARAAARAGAAALAVVLLVAGIVLAAGGPESYRPLRSAPGTYRSATLSSADSADWTTPLSTSGATQSVVSTAGNPNLLVGGSFSAASATVKIVCGLWHRSGSGVYTFLGLAGSATLTASATELWDGTNFASESPLLFDTSAATHYELRIGAPSAGTLQLRPILFGAASK